MILVLDNYDSFVYNLARYLNQLGQLVRVERNDTLDIHQIRDMRPSAIVISPGPCTPNEAGISLEAVRELSGEIPLLGVCLGHQAIAAALGGQVIRAVRPMHGRASMIRHRGGKLFAGLPEQFQVGRYHSLVVERSTLPSIFEIDAESDDGTVMAISHREAPTFGVQFHPESVLTEHGYALLANFLKLAGLEVGPLPPGPCSAESADAATEHDAYWTAPL